MDIAEEIALRDTIVVSPHINESGSEFNEKQQPNVFIGSHLDKKFDKSQSPNLLKGNISQIDDHEIEPTPEELSTLKRISDQIPLAAWLIVICELCERFAFYGLSGLFQNYIEFPPHLSSSEQPGALNRGRPTASALTNFFRFFAYVTPILGAILADQYWGKYKTIVVSCGVYMIGLLVLLLTSIPPSISAGVAFPGLIIAMVILGFGTGGVKSNVSPLMAEQYTRTKAVVRGNKNNF